MSESPIPTLDPKSDGSSPDIVAENIDKLHELFPDVFKDSSFKGDVVKTDAVQILRQRGIEDVKGL